jgi:hypothetical protein
MKKKGLFSGKPRSKALAEIVTLEGIVKARKAAVTLKKKYRQANRRDTKTHIKRAAVLAANRADAAARRKGLSKRQKKKLRRIAQIYRAAARDMK